jgi:hypothetical protein
MDSEQDCYLLREGEFFPMKKVMCGPSELPSREILEECALYCFDSGCVNSRETWKSFCNDGKQAQVLRIEAIVLMVNQD